MCLVNYVPVHGTVPTNKNNRIFSSFFDVPIICHALSNTVPYILDAAKFFGPSVQLSRSIKIPGPLDPKYRQREGILYSASR